MKSIYTELEIAGRKVGSGHPVFIIGEVAQTHDGSLGMARAFIDAVAAAGADAVKFQTHIAAAETTPHEPWRVKFSVQDATRYDYWKRMEFSEQQWRGLKEHADARGILFLSSPFSPEAVELLIRLNVPGWKAPAGEVSNLSLLEQMAKTGLPVLLSSGMSDLAELDRAVECVRRNKAAVAVLQCTTAYPCPPEKIGVNLIGDFRRRFKCPVGLSDHSGEIYPGMAAIEKGLTQKPATISNPSWTRVFESFGAPAARAERTEDVSGALADWKMSDGPMFMEAVFESGKYLEMVSGIR